MGSSPGSAVLCFASAPVLENSKPAEACVELKMQHAGYEEVANNTFWEDVLNLR